MEQDDRLPRVGEIIIVRVNHIPQPAVVCRRDRAHNEVLVRFINDDVVVSEMNYVNQFGTNISIVENASHYIPFRLEDVLDYTYLNMDELENLYNEIMIHINYANLILPPQGGQRKFRSKKSNKGVKRNKRSKQQK
jgi:hypothetical protein